MQDLIQEQIRIEEQSLEAGKERYYKLLSIKGHAETTVGKRLIAAHVDAFTQAIKEYLHQSLEVKRRGRRAAYALLMKDIEPVSMAMLALRVVFQGISEGSTISNVAQNIGSLIAEHVNWKNLKALDETKTLAKVIEKQVAQTQHERHRRAVTRHVTHSHLPPELTVDWSRVNTIQIGLVLLELMETSTDLIKMPNVRKRGKTVKVLELTDRAMEFLESNHERVAVLNPIFSPMVVPPQKWTTTTKGGYLTRSGYLVKNRNLKYQASLKEEDLSQVMEAVNTLQETAYRVNMGILRVLTEALDGGYRVANIPPADKEPEPAKPNDIAENEEARRLWKEMARGVHERNAQRISRWVSLQRTKDVATEYSKYERIYFPHFLDWRGRAYPMPVDFQPQGSDFAKALLEYAEGMPLGADGAWWLKVHVANLFGVDKVSLVERALWTEEHMGLLLDSAMFPLGSDEEGCGEMFWMEADKKKQWQALAACFELLGYSIEGEDYVSHLPIAMDGSCNGLQNLSAMLLDEVGGRATNLLPSSTPQDIYTQVMHRTTEKLEAVSKGDDEELSPLAKHWMEMGLNRKLVKRPVMTKPYGVTAFGMRDQIIKEMKDQGIFYEMTKALFPDTKEGKALAKKYRFSMTKLLSELVEESIGEIVVASRDVMDWLQAVAKEAAARNLPLSWYTPIGLKVLQDYRRMDTALEAVFVGGQQKRFNVTYHTDQINKQKQSNGMSPNVIHSLDASHMMLTMLKGKEHGITSYSMVHDSYATHACNTGLLNAVLREAFVEMYSADVLGDLREQFVSQVEPEIAEKFPPVPEKGSLDLSAVRESDYFFA